MAALAMFGAGLLTRGYGKLFLGPVFPHGDLAAAHVPEGMMLGAGLAALIQVGATLLRGDRSGNSRADVSRSSLRLTLGGGFVVYLCLATLLALAGGLATHMSRPLLAGFVVYAAAAALLHELIIGLAAMHSGWFPAFAVAVVSLMAGLLIGFPAPALALLVGFTAATGPAFADMGCDLRAGFLLRGKGADADFERDGRRQQLYAALYALVIAAIVVGLAARHYFAAHKVAPVDHVFVAAIRAGASPALARALLIWAVPGALLQLAGGSRRQLGVLFATGLLLVSPAAGWAVLAGLVARLVWMRRAGEEGRAGMEVFAAGTIAGDALFSFGGALWGGMRAR